MSQPIVEPSIPRFLESLFEQAPYAVIVADSEGRVLRANPVACRILGGSEDELRGRPLAGILDELGGGRGRARRLDGTTLPVSIRSGPFALDGEPTGSVASFTELTDSDRAADVLLRSEALLRTIIENSRDGINLLDLATGKYLFMSPAQVALTGFTADEMAHMTAEEAFARVHPDDRHISVDQQRAIAAGDRELATVEYRWKVKSGEYRWFSDSRTVIANGDGRPVALVGISRDITDRVRAEEALRQTVALYTALIDSSTDEIWFADRDARFTLVNPAARHEFSLAPGEPVEVRALATRLTVLRADGTPRPVEEAPPLRALRGETVRNEAELILTPGSPTLRNRRVSATPVRDPAGTVIGSLSVVRDVTDEVTLQERLQVTARLAALGTLVAGVAHEINNPLAAEAGNVEFARRAVDELRARLRSDTPVPPVDAAEILDGVAEALGDSMDSVRRMGGIVRELTAFGRNDALLQRVRLREVVEMSLRWFAASAEGGLAVSVEDSGPPAVLAVPGHLAQVLLNLLTNAWQARTGDRMPHVVVRLGAGAPGWVRLEVADDGGGMPPEVLARAFDPFFTTREVGQGIGLGLSICHSVVTAHGGQITATSRPGEGTTVRIDLPAADATDAAAAAPGAVTLRA